MGTKTKAQERQEFEANLQKGSPSTAADREKQAPSSTGHTSAAGRILDRQAGGLIGMLHEKEQEIAKLNVRLAAAGKSDPESLAKTLGLSIEELQVYIDAFRKGYVLKAIEPHKITKLFLQRRSENHVNNQAFKDLVASIDANGQKVPAYVRPLSDGNYELIAGRRRRDAASVLKRTLVSFVKDMDDEEALKLQKIENEQRTNESAWELANWYNEQLKRGYFGGQLSTLAEHYDDNKSAVSELLKMLTLPNEIVTAFTSPEAIRVRWSRDIFRALEANRDNVFKIARALKEADVATARGDEIVYKRLVSSPVRITTPTIVKNVKVTVDKKKVQLYYGSWSREKGLSLSVHKRHLNEEQVKSVLLEFEKTLRRYVKDIP